MKLCHLNFSQSLASVKGSGFITCLLLFGTAIADVFVGGSSGGSVGNNVGGGDARRGQYFVGIEL